jgi:C-terminal processing protease CtpA/Prc
MAILIGPENSSATFQFALTARTAGLATLIGQTTGGNLRGINGGAFFFATLPQSGIVFDLPVIGTFPERPQPDGGLAPDIAVAAAISDIASGSDPAMQRAVDHLLRG